MSPAARADLLLVEDNPSDLELTLRALERSGFAAEVETVKDGAEALDYLFCAGAYAPPRIVDMPKVIFLDLKLPKIMGLEVLRKIKTHERTRLLPVVILTSSQQDKDIQQAYDLGANGYVVKPIDFDQLERTITIMSRYWLRLNHAPLNCQNP